MFWRATLPLLLLIGLIALASWAYFPGLNGGFLFDDYANLPALGADGPVTSLDAFWRYVTSGQADPIGRPIALASFLFDAHDWPAAAYSFKRTNLLLHLLNGALLTGLLYRLGSLLYSDAKSSTRRVAFAAVLGAGFWLLHPFLVSTTMYVVQREAMLPATFTLLGLLAWLHGRTILLRGETIHGLSWLAIALPGCTLLATLSKANGILLPALALTIEYILPRNALDLAVGREACASASDDRSRTYRQTMWILAGLPTFTVIAYLLYSGWHGFTHDLSAVRSWTLGERLLTEPRVIMEYLRLLWLPRPLTSGLFNDHFTASQSLYSPPSTLLCLLALIALLCGSVMLRQRWPATAMAMLFYLAGQSLESTTVALELYFEHRNYLPAMLMFWPLALYICNIRQKTSNSSNAFTTSTNLNRFRLALAIIVILGLTLMTRTAATVWGDERQQALLWATLSHDSPRAQVNAAMEETAAGQPRQAIARLRPLLEKQPDQVQIALNLISATCSIDQLDTATLAASSRALRTTHDTGTLLISWFDRAIDQSVKEECTGFNLAAIKNLVEAAQANLNLTKHAGRRQDLYFLQGRIALMERDAPTALKFFNLALDQQIRASIALRQAALLGSAGFPQQGLCHLDHYNTVRGHEDNPDFGMPRIHAWILTKQHYWDSELQRLRLTLADDASRQGQ
jgi:tetratricopeptide (TPR) repeat protein